MRVLNSKFGFCKHDKEALRTVHTWTNFNTTEYDFEDL